MCSIIAKVTPTRVVILDGPCCMRVEDIERLCPKISRANGWGEYYLTEVPRRPNEYRISLAGDIAARLEGSPVVTFIYRGATLHFRNAAQLHVVRNYIADKLRKPRRYSGYERYLRALPAKVLASRARRQVLSRLDALLAKQPATSGLSGDGIRYEVNDAVGVMRLGQRVSKAKTSIRRSPRR